MLGIPSIASVPKRSQVAGGLSAICSGVRYSASMRAARAPHLVRCGWATSDPLYIAYHDGEWGAPSHDDRHLFEMLLLEGAQAGLSFITILRKREGYRRAFDRFDPAKVSRYD